MSMRNLSGTCLLLLATTSISLAALSPSGTSEPPLFVVLTDTGVKRDGLPVLKLAPEARRYHEVLEHGFSGRLLRLYWCVQRQRFGRDGTPIEPAYLAITGNQGGFPRFGFFLHETPKRGVAYIDLHRNSPLSGRFGAMDQIFPHELMHVIVRQLAGEGPEGGANQVHAIAVRTDPQTAFNEGFAEVAQVLAVDDQDAVPETRALAADTRRAQNADSQFHAYGRALTAVWAPAPCGRLTFPLWFSQSEQVLRYHAVKANRFAFEPPIPDRLLRGPDVYRAYLIENVVPGDRSGGRKSQGQMLSTEGVVSALFSRWVADKALQARYCEPSFYASFGVKPGEVPPLENAYLKLFHALDHAKPHDAAALVRAYLKAFPEEATAVEAVMRSIGLDPHWQPPVEIWLANTNFHTGTSLFDQFRGRPQTHTFDLNAASLVDLMSVEGMTRATAEAIRRGAPYAGLSDQRRVPEVSPKLAARFTQMEAAMRRLRAEAVEEGASMNLSAILKPYGYRAALWLGVGTVIAALLYRRVRSTRWWRAALNGFVIALLGLLAGWLVEGLGGALPWLVPVVVFGVPAALWQLAWRKSRAGAGRVFAAWALAAAVPFLLTRAWF
jgi:hypothetical protein